MTKMFIGGSRRVSRLNGQVRERLDDMMGKGYSIIVGDANGADRALQEYLHGKNYRDVEVFCSEGFCRNNVGSWRQQDIPTGRSRRDAQFYSAKDRAMAKEATCGFMLWDGKSVGTLINLYRLLSLGKNAAVYSVPDGSMTEFRNHIEWEEFLQSRDIGLQQKVDGRRKLEPSTEFTQTQMPFME